MSTDAIGVLCVGHAVQDFVFTLDVFPDVAEKHQARDFESVGGGPAATAAVAIAKLGGNALLSARLGNDLVANLVIAELESYGVDCSLVRRFDDAVTSVSSVLVDKAGERQIVNYLDSSIPSDADWLPQELPSSVHAVLVDTRWPEGALHALRLAREAGIPGILDGDVPVPADGELVRLASHVAFSAPGLQNYAGTVQTAEALGAVSQQTDAICCVTLGGDGVLLAINGKLEAFDAIDVGAVDTLGAGDVWHGAFAIALAEGRSVTDAITFASAAAALKVRNGTGRKGAPSRGQVEQLLKNSSENVA